MSAHSVPGVVHYTSHNPENPPAKPGLTDRLVYLEQKLKETTNVLNDTRVALREITSAAGVGATPVKTPDGQDLWLLRSPHASISPLFNVPTSQKHLTNVQPTKPSRFCMDLLEMEGVVRYHLNEQASQAPEHRVSIDTFVQRGLLSLVRDRWKWSNRYYFETLGLEKLGPLTRWRVMPTYENYMAVQPQFRPTKLQMTQFHWPIVDWFPFPNVRDRMIEHAGELDLTDVLLASMNAHCMEVDVSEPYWDPVQYQGVEGRSPVNGEGMTEHHIKYYRLKDYIDHIENRENYSRRTSSLPEPPQISKALEAKFILALSSPDTWFKMDPTFFERYPVLYCKDAVARGTYASLYDNEED